MADIRRFLSPEEAKPPLFAGIDLGGTNIKLGVVDDAGRPLAVTRFATQSRRGPEEGAKRMGEGVLELIEALGLKKGELAGAGLGSPGTMDVPAGMLLEPHNLPGWFNFPIRDRVSHYCGLPVTFGNDAGAAAYGEFWVGSGKALQSLILLTLGTGVGGGIIIDHLSIDGHHSHGAECGHIVIDSAPDARLCPCGQRGHLEAYASATAVTKRAEEALAGGRKSSLAKRTAEGEPLTPKLLAEEAEAGDELSLATITETARYLGIGIVTLMHTIDPEGVILGGAMTFGGAKKPMGIRFLDRVREEVRQRAFPVLAERCSINYATLGGDAGYIGAAGIARQAYLKTKSTR